MSPADVKPVETVESVCVCVTTQTDSGVESASTPPQERTSRFRGDVFFDAMVGVELRRAPGFHFLISRCGRFVINDKFPHITKIYRATQHVRDSYAYLNIERIKLHRLVALAWVYNPAPNEFTCVDHIDGDRMNNNASNLRWLNAALNMQNRSSDREYKYYRGPFFSNGGVFFNSYIFRDGKEEKLKTHGSRAEATAHGKKMRELKFTNDYNAYRASDRDSALARPPHMFLWTDTPMEISCRDRYHNSRFRKVDADRSPCFTV
jgi:hypothetical protein